MTDWTALREPFPEDEIQHRPGAATWAHRDSCAKRQCRETRDPDKHIQFSYVDARVVAQRLDDVLTPEGWDFTWSLEPGDVVHGRLIIGGNIREDAGYPNSDSDEEPIKSAVSDALKRAAVLFGVGRHLYEDNKGGRAVPARQERPVAPAPVQQRPRPHVVDTDLLEPDDEEPFDEAAPMRRPEAVQCPYHPDREVRKNSRGYYCSGKSGNGPKNENGYCSWTAA